MVLKDLCRKIVSAAGLLWVLAALAGTHLPAPAAAQGGERILSYDSHITINPDATLTVVETIKVVAASIQIKRGIYRDFPTQYQDRQGNRVTVAFTVISVLRDGNPENHFTRSQGNGVRLYMGQKDNMLDPGEHTYVITYKTNQQIGFFTEFDELFWNVTGHKWQFPIEKASATLVLPSGAQVLQRAAYTGPYGAKGTDFTVSTPGPRTIRFETTRTLNVGEGLTIAVAWPKGLIAEPPRPRIKAEPPPQPGDVKPAVKPLWLRAQGVPVWLAGFLALVGWYLYAWNRVGRDPESRTPVPLFEPPDGLSAGAVRYIFRSAHDDRTFAAALVGLATRGIIKIRQLKNGYSIDKAGAVRGLSPGEKALIKPLFKYGKSVKVTGKYNARVRIANDKLRDALRNEFEGYTVIHNLWWLVPGFIGTFVVLIPLIFSQHYSADAFSVAVLGSGATMLTYGFFRIALRRFQDKRWIAGSIFTALFLAFLAFVVYAFNYAYVFLSPWLVIGTVATVALFLTFYHLLKRRTPEGTDLLRRLKGFRMYLETAERDRLEALHPPKRTPELFEKLLPYAMALDVENAWAKGFEEEMKRAGQDPDAYQPAWYEGDTSGLHSLPTTLGSAFASTVASSTVKPASSSSGSSYSPGSFSGSSGGGFSGGGGGGGGGGGW